MRIPSRINTSPHWRSNYYKMSRRTILYRYLDGKTNPAVGLTGEAYACAATRDRFRVSSALLPACTASEACGYGRGANAGYTDMAYIVPPDMHTPPGFTGPLGFVVLSVPSSLRLSLEESLRLPNNHLPSFTRNVYASFDTPKRKLQLTSQVRFRWASLC